ncbi:uncharacterized protein JN550_005370 [Neoarthrinium moseri]|uniref:uncharacterized protein n=1 Tax=Neoarthrinium moseri TaxID=1658444 RepID=UPI001FDDD93C|nr:uncharacterized protein JN550_005370 [Neoarthrinium moseri]KAI1870442.1 hypothetical protein JN550_005370 [Neoarthrinium moseri]
MHRLQNNDHIVIVGGGSIGLCTAYNLAKRSSDSSPQIRITVIEVGTEPFNAASSSCTGCFHYGFTEPQLHSLLPLGRYSFDLWEDEAKNVKFREDTGYRAQSSFGLNSGSGQGLDKLPDWVRKEMSWDVNSSVLGDRTATVNPPGVGKWLRSECLRNGVEIRTDLKVVGAKLLNDNEVQEVVCLKNGQHTIRIECKQLLLACGPWTPTVYEMLFPSSPIRLQWTTDAGDWISFENPCPTTRDTTAFVSFANLVGEKLEFAARNDGTIWACGRRNFTATLPPPNQHNEPDLKLIEELSDYAKDWLNWNCDCDKTHDIDFQLRSTGRAFRPATKSGLPIISEVSPLDLVGDL